MIVRADGFILTAHHLVKGAREIQVRLRNGEIFDKAEIVGVDERRNVALLRINAAGLRTMPSGTIEESQVGARIFIITNPTGETQITNTILNSVQLADSIQGAGNSYRVLQFAGRNQPKIDGTIRTFAGFGDNCRNFGKKFGDFCCFCKRGREFIF